MQKKGTSKQLFVAVFVSLIILSVVVIAGPAGKTRVPDGTWDPTYGYGYKYITTTRITGGGGGSSGTSGCCDPVVNYATWHCCNSPPSFLCCASPEAPVCRPYCTLISCLGGTTFDPTTGTCVIGTPTTTLPPVIPPAIPPEQPPAGPEGTGGEGGQGGPPPGEGTPPPQPEVPPVPPQVNQGNLTDAQKQAIAAAIAAAAALGIIGGISYAFWRKP